MTKRSQLSFSHGNRASLFFCTCIVLAALPQSPGPDGGFRGYAFAYFDTVDNATIAKDALNGTGPGPFAGPRLGVLSHLQ